MQVDFERDAGSIILLLEKSIYANLGVLDSIGSLYAASEFVERGEFRTFVTHGMLQRPGIQALAWVPKVPASQRTAYEESARNEGYADFQIVERQAQGVVVPATFRDEYFPVYYVEPYQGNEIVLGVDLTSIFAYREAMDKARDTGKKVATQPAALVQESNNKLGFLVFLPIYRNGAPIETLSDRRENLIGLILGVYRIKDMVGNSVDQADPEVARPDLEIQLYDRSAPVDEQLLLTESFSSELEGQSRLPLRFGDTFDVAGRSWEIVIASSASPPWLIWQGWAALMAGLLLTGCLLKFLLAGLRRTAVTERLVATRTLELSQSNHRLGEEVAERKRTEEALRESKQRIRELAAASVQAHEEERLWTAFEVHDRIGQLLIVVFQQLQSLQRRTRAHSEQQKGIIRATDLLQEAISESRNIMNDLYPSGLDEFGLVSLMETELASLEEATGCRVSFAADCQVRAPRNVEVTVWRIFREALTNLRRHAPDANNLNVALTCSDQVTILEVQDDGPGFDLSAERKARHLGGIKSMQRRAEVLGGSFEMTSTPGQGTGLTVRIPVEGARLSEGNLDYPSW